MLYLLYDAIRLPAPATAFVMFYLKMLRDKLSPTYLLAKSQFTHWH